MSFAKRAWQALASLSIENKWPVQVPICQVLVFDFYISIPATSLITAETPKKHAIKQLSN